MILSRLEAGDPEFEKAFGRHVHFGAWLDPDNAYEDQADSIIAMDRLCQHLIGLAEIGNGQDVLDVGCGFGGTLATLDEQFEGMRLTGLNIDERQLARARRLVPRSGNTLQFVLGDACQMTFPQESFDRILAVECIFHFPSRKTFFEHAARVLRPGGHLTLSDFLRPEDSGANFDTDRDPLWGEHSFIDLPAYQQLAADVGLTVTHAEDISLHVRPTYYWFGKALGQHFPEAEEVTNTGRFIMDAGGIGYCNLRFSKGLTV